MINFHDWPEERAQSYPEVFDIVERLVKPVRAQNSRAARRDRWWQFAERAPKLYEAVRELDRVLVVARVSRTAMPAMVPTGQVMNEKIVVFPTDQPEMLAFLDSTFHSLWAWNYSATLKTDLQYAPSDVFETLPLPRTGNTTLRDLGNLLGDTRTKIMRERGEGLTKLYNAIHDDSVIDSGVRQLRDIHESVDRAIAESYGWPDLDITHGFHKVRRGQQHTLAPNVQVEIIDRLLELNHGRHNSEVEGAASPSRPHMSAG
ncbi:type IIL restriction-modification enzyme MmeI [Streptomyces canus]|uniref:type IIL restriction-modification enzyme MmeI n=1 Tax=Streptomyces canus TaxID=58343 RepID=UPI0033BE6201